jgi:hypothetical protein
MLDPLIHTLDAELNPDRTQIQVKPKQQQRNLGPFAQVWPEKLTW